MSLELAPATQEHEAAIAELFASIGVPIASTYWGRAYSPDSPRGFASAPLVAFSEGGRLVGFCARRLERFDVSGDECLVAVLHDIAVRPGDDAARALEQMLAHHGLGASFSIAAGTGAYLSRQLELMRWQDLGPFRRYILRGAQQAGIARRGRDDIAALAGLLEPADAIDREFEEAGERLFEERRIFRRRRTADLAWRFRKSGAGEYICLAHREAGRLLGYAVLLPVEGRAGTEYLVADIVSGMPHLAPLLAGLRQWAIARAADVYLSVVCDEWDEPLRSIAYEPLPPRWPVFWNLSADAPRTLGAALMRRGPWFLTSADLELDRG